MKKHISIITILITIVNQSNTMHNTAEQLPIIGAFQELNVDGREFLPELAQGKPSPTDLLSFKLQTRCSKLNKGEITSDLVKDTEILNFAKDMAMHEKKWKNWHVTSVRNEDKKGEKKHFLETKLYTGKVDKNGNETITTIRRDENSPYYQWASTDNPNIVTDNLIENELYHNELKFLKTQLRKMDLYWNTKPEYANIFEWVITRFINRPTKKELQREDFNETRNRLKQEIKSFKNKRMRFTRSCLKSTDFENLQNARNTYSERHTENIS